MLLNLPRTSKGLMQLLCALPLACIVGGCKASTTGGSPADTGPGSQSSLRDAGPIPLVKLHLAGRYLETNVAPDRAFSMAVEQIDSTRIGLNAAGMLVTKSAVIESYPAQVPILGRWKIYNGTAISFVPAAPLKPGDYLIRFPNAGPDFVVTPRPYNLIRVGSAVRLSSVRVMPAKDSKRHDLVDIDLHFSEIDPKRPPTVSIEQARGSSFSSLGLTARSPVKWRATTAIDLDLRLKITVAGPTIDGAFLGRPSGSLTLTFVPRDHLSGDSVVYYVEPKLSIELPSGKKRQ